jgi:hypothetical protein
MFVMKKSFFLVSLLLACLFSFSQLQSKADLSITSLTIKDDLPLRNGNSHTGKTSFAPLKCSITVHNAGTNGVHKVMVAVVLPPDIHTITTLHTANKYYSGTGNRGGWLGSLFFELYLLDAGQDMTIEFTFTRSATHANTIGAYVFSGSPDTNPSNNSASATY